MWNLRILPKKSPQYHCRGSMWMFLQWNLASCKLQRWLWWISQLGYSHLGDLPRLMTPSRGYLGFARFFSELGTKPCWFVVLLWDIIVIYWDINGIYPLVNLQKAIENGPVEIVVIFPLIAWWIFPWQNVSSPEGIAMGGIGCPHDASIASGRYRMATHHDPPSTMFQRHSGGIHIPTSKHIYPLVN